MAASASPGRKAIYAFAAGQVKRWHAMGHVVRTQDVAQHSHGVATLISILHPDPSARLLKAALHHDLPEARTGDPPRYVKQGSPELIRMIARIEKEVMRTYQLSDAIELTEEERSWLEACDLFDAWMFLLQNILCQNEMVRGAFRNVTIEIRRKADVGEYPIEVLIAMEQVLAAYSWVKTW